LRPPSADASMSRRWPGNQSTHTHTQREKQKVLNTRHGAAISNNISKYKNNTQQTTREKKKKKKKPNFPNLFIIVSKNCLSGLSLVDFLILLFFCYSHDHNKTVRD
jgi:hypothetical protein